MKKKYIAPSIEVVLIRMQSIICTSDPKPDPIDKIEFFDDETTDEQW